MKMASTAQKSKHICTQYSLYLNERKIRPQDILYIVIDLLLFELLDFRCVTYCKASGHTYAGMGHDDGKTCICTIEEPLNRSEGKCTIKCPGDQSSYCGGKGAITVRQNPTIHSSNLSYIGCFNNSLVNLDRLLPIGSSWKNTRENTPAW